MDAYKRVVEMMTSEQPYSGVGTLSLYIQLTTHGGGSSFRTLVLNQGPLFIRVRPDCD